MHAPKGLSGITDCLCKKHTLFGPQFELLRRGFLVAVVEPGRQPLRRGEQINVACDEARIRVVIRLLNFRVSDPTVRLPWSRIISREVNDEENIHRR